MAFEGFLEGQEARLAVRVLRGFDLGIEIGMAPERPLREHDQAARQDIRALDRDADRRNLIGGLQVIAGAVADGLAAVNVEGGVEAARMRSVHWYFIRPEITAGLAPWLTMAEVTARAASSV